MRGIENIIVALKSLGFTTYESKIYLSLLKNYPLNGNEIAVDSGVPAPKVYGTIRKMIEKGIVFQLSDNNSNRVVYKPLPYKHLLEIENKKFKEKLNFLNTKLEETSVDKTLETELFLVQGYSNSLDFIKEEIKQSKKSVLISLWDKEFGELFESISQAYDKGCKVTTMVFDKHYGNLPWNDFEHYNIGRAYNRHLGELSVVIDDRKSILLQKGESVSHAVVSSNSSAVNVTKNYIRHDIYINRVIFDFEDELLEHYGKQLEKLINDF